ncbi:MAG: hypothetical protein R6U62_00955 [Bacteroidales bacterium]
MNNSFRGYKFVGLILSGCLMMLVLNSCFVFRDSGCDCPAYHSKPSGLTTVDMVDQSVFLPASINTPIHTTSFQGLPQTFHSHAAIRQ